MKLLTQKRFNSVKFVFYKDLREFCSDLKKIYTSNNEKQGYEELQNVKEKWKDKYIAAFKTWEENRDVICPFFQFLGPLRKIMYTTNTIESLNRQFRKYTKTKSVFPSDISFKKSKNGALTDCQKWFNTQISRYKIYIDTLIAT